MDRKKYKGRLLRHLLSVPVIYIMIIPLIILHFFFEVYHAICFPLYGISKLNRSDYIKLDRHRLKYLSLIDKINCTYCGYANGLLLYASTIAGKTEQYWCGIKHKADENSECNVESEHHKDFVAYGDEENYKERYLK